MYLAHLQQWIGRTERHADLVTATPVAALSATLDSVPALAPPAWLYFTPRARHSEIGPDGHPKRGGFLPPVALPRRMWAGGRLVFHQPLRVGDQITRVSRIADVRAKAGHSGSLVFVNVHHDIADARGVAITEEHDIVYRDNPRAGRGRTRAAAGARPRFLAPLFNGHRIHYDRSYVTEVEGYPGLIVHGPLIATLLLDLPPFHRLRPSRRRPRRPVVGARPRGLHGDGSQRATFLSTAMPPSAECR